MDRVQYEQSEGLDNGYLLYPARCVFHYADRVVRHRDCDACRQVEGVCQARHAGLVLPHPRLLRLQALRASPRR